MNNILIVRLSAIGDIVFASPFARAIKKTFPHARLSWLVDHNLAPLIDQSPLIDECISVDTGTPRKLWREGNKAGAIKTLLAFGKTLKARQFDTVIDLQGLMKSGLLAWTTSAPRRVSLGGREGSRFLMTEVYPRGGEEKKIGAEYRFLAEQLKLDTTDFFPQLYLNEAAQKTAREKLAAHSLLPKKYAVFAAFTTRPQKHWVVDHWRALATKISQETGLVPVLLGGNADKNAAQILREGTNIINLTGQTSLAESMAIVAEAGALMGVDTGLTHMGIAFGVPTVAIFGSTCPYLHTGKKNAAVIWLNFPCSPCRRHPSCAGDDFACLKEITSSRVMETLATVMSASP